MKEFETKAQLTSLTSQSNPFTLDVRGPRFNRGEYIFMGEQGEASREAHKNSAFPKTRTEREPRLGKQRDIEISPQRIELAREKWSEHYKWRGKKIEELPFDERQSVEAAIRTGVAPMGGGAEELFITDYNADARLQDMATVINREIINTGRNPEPRFLQHYINELSDLRRAGTFATDEARQQAVNLETRLNSWLNEAIAPSAGRERFGLYLQPEDMNILNTDPIKWLDGQFDILYKLAREGQELTSPIVSNMQTVVSEAIRYMQYNNPENLDRFQQLFTIRFNLIQMRTTIGYKDIDSIRQTAYRLQTHGLLYGLSLEDGSVGAMFNRLHELLEDERLKQSEHHVTPELSNRLQDMLVNEQRELKERGVGIFAGKTDEDIVRAVRTAYDAFVSSQRQAVVVARGRHLTGADAFFSDPASGPLNVYNIEDLLIEKFGIFNVHENHFLKEIKLDMADTSLRDKGIDPKSVSQEERFDLGTRLFRDLFAVPDFFSSGWRIKGIKDSLEERFGKDKSLDFALFMRLTGTAPDKREDIRWVWEKIARYRPEEIVRLFRERENDDLEELYEKLQIIDTDLTPSDDEKDRGMTTYDKFKEKYGSSLRILREHGFQKDVPEQINMAELTSLQLEILDKALGDEAGNNITAIFKELQTYIDEKNMISTLLTDTRFEDIYTRTILIDDALLDRLEIEEGGFTPLSKIYAADQGGDALVRIWNDTGNAVKAAQNLVAFIKTENVEKRMQSAEAFADATSQYSGEEARAKCIRYTIGTFLNLSKQDFIWDVLGVGKLPFRKAMSKIEKIYGPQATPMSRDTLRAYADHYHSLLLKRAQTEDEEEKADKMYREIERILEITPVSTAKRRAASFIFYLILAAITEAYEVSGVKDFTGRK